MSEDIGVLRGTITLDSKPAERNVDDFCGSLGGLKEAALGAAIGFIGVNGLAGAFDKVIEGVKASIKAAVDFETHLAKIQAYSGATAGEMKNLSSGVTDLAKRYGRDAGGLATALYDVMEAGISSRDSLAFLDTTIRGAVASGADYKTVINALDSTLDSFNMTTSQAPEILDKLLVGAKAGEMSLSDMASTLSV